MYKKFLRIAWIVTLAAIISCLLTMPMFAVFSGRPDILFESMAIGLIFGGALTVFALLFVIPLAVLAWLFCEETFERLKQPHLNSPLVLAPLSIMIGNLVFYVVSSLIFGNGMNRPTLVGFAVSLGTPVAVVSAPFIARRTFRAGDQIA